MTHPDRAENQYRIAVEKLHDALDETVLEAFKPVLNQIEEREEREAERQDAPEDVALVEVVEDLIIRLGAPRSMAQVQAVVQTAAEGASEHNAKQLGQILNIDPRSAADQPAIDGFIRENVELITGLNGRLQADIRRQVTEAINQGINGRQLRIMIQDRLSVSRSRARLIARDQIGKLNGQLNSARQQRAGVTHYTWRTSDDVRVRRHHHNLDRSRQAWNSPPIVDPKRRRREHPGGDFQCRCQAIPVIDFDTIRQEPEAVDVAQPMQVQNPAPDPRLPRPVRRMRPRRSTGPRPSTRRPTGLFGLTMQKVIEIQRLLLDRQSIARISTRVGVSKRTVRKIAQEMGLAFAT